ncbi:cation:proton antiporter [Streptomyces xinghaiensis]|uniref:Na+/H+ transporter n=1 Tax=Streptomyces xinghaiensis TaxID=1038928 RepID=A0A068VRD6_9ACTN|nr:cation:proton antiporter [Streptomyces xinghaiensis]MZE81329.1 cation:proton antiporter [Streptomyces sp. SID5475]CDP39157.1 Na+/H+ transporter [Streptomyces xinghaiensis]
MSLATHEVAQTLIALILLLIVAHCVAYLFKAVRQPPVIGEILGGLLLGPTVLGNFSPELQRQLIPAEGPAASAIGAIYQLGLLLLIYLAGTELHGHVTSTERRTITAVSLSGLLIPFAAGLAIAASFDLGELTGPHGSDATLVLVFGMAIALTSIPVISRIMLDLGILGTRFARIVLTVAVLEDVLLYVVLAIVLGMAGAMSGDAYGLGMFFAGGPVVWSALYFTAAPIAFLLVHLRYGRTYFTAAARLRWNVLAHRSPTAYLMVFVFSLCLVCIGLGLDPIFGALTAGICDAGTARGEQARETLRKISLSFFIPVYFAVVGLQLDLIRHFDVLFFLWFLAVACAVKFSSVWLGARLAGQSRGSAANIAAAMNARGGPGIVLASVTFSAGIVSEGFFTSLVVLSIVTSQMAGMWLSRVVDRGDPLLSEDPEDPDAAEAAGRMDGGSDRKAVTP